MSELRERLHVLDDIQTPDQWPDIVVRPGRTYSEPGPMRRIAVAALAVVVFSVGALALIRAFGGEAGHSRRHSSPAAAKSAAAKPAAYTLVFPQQVAGPDANGNFFADAETNLPKDTRVYYIYSLPDGTGSAGCCYSVQNGRVAVEFGSLTCSTRTVKVTLIVAASYDPWTDGPMTATHRHWQPPQVLSLLGQNFERLTGPAVRTDSGMPELVASTSYFLPRAGCSGAP
jgi:hypothetical protein